MALSVSPYLVASAAPVSNVGVAPTLAVPDNCHTIIVLNTTATAGLVGQQTVGTALVAGTNAMTVPAGGSLTLAVGTFTQRGTMDPAVQPNSGLVYGSVGAGITLQVLYLCTFGPV
ncbi:MAG: hypothetical protein EBZ50_06955 [Alphaproteobacteria bacterium]|nr:hypothetical protein [Alphaproteobacteria bacterium]